MSQRETTIDLTPVSGDRRLDLEQYFGLWAVAEEQFFGVFDRVKQLNLAAHIEAGGEAKAEAAARPATNARTAEVTIGLIDVSGTLMKRGTSLSSSSSLINLRRVVRSAARDTEIDAIMLRVDSPGGTLAGTEELAQEIRRARESKPVYGFIEDLAASAAYWLVSQCEKVYANTPTALAGSIGTFIGLYDYSAYAAKEGIKAIVIRTADLKGSGFPGTEISEAQQAYWQELVDKAQTQFNGAVAAGRGVKAETVAAEWATGRVYMAADAAAMGMIDGVKSFDAVIAELTERVRTGPARKPTRSRSATMSEEKQIAAAESLAPKAATIAELRAACPGADAEFLMARLEQGATVAQAQSAWISEQQKRVTAAEAKAAEAEAKAAEAEKKAALPGVDALGSGGKAEADGGDAIERWEAAVEKKMLTVKDRRKAMAAVVHADPDLHQAYLDAVNAAK